MRRDSEFKMKVSTRVEEAIKLLQRRYRDSFAPYEFYSAINFLSNRDNANIFLVLEGDDQKQWIKTSIGIFDPKE